MKPSIKTGVLAIALLLIVQTQAVAQWSFGMGVGPRQSPD